MRPIELTISAFGSYKGKETIDFTQLGDNGVFLISGKTGAGKSTIFDAISFALFGESSGTLRKAPMLRSELADPTTKPFVKLRFEYAGKEYTVERSLQYEGVAKKRKRDENGQLVETTTTINADATLSSPDFPTISTIRSVDSKIHEILGINHDQFTKIAMIPQGEFQKLLQADNNSKQEILRKVFGTERFQKIEEDIAKEVTDIDTSRKEKLTNIRTLLDSIMGNEKSETYASFTQSKEKFDDPRTQLDPIIILIEAFIKEDQTLFEDSKKALTICKETNVTLNNLKSDIERNNSEIKKRENTIKEINRLKSNLAELEKEQVKNPERKKEAEEKKGEKVLLENQLPLYPKYEKDSIKLKEDQKNLEKNKQILKEAREKREALIKEKDTLEAEKKSLESSDVEKEKTEQEGKELKTTIDSLNELKDKIIESENVLSEYSKAYNELQDLLKAKNKDRDSYESAHNLFLCSQAGFLAKDLSEGMPCPVCGSVHHPSKAALPQDAPSEKKVKELKDSYERTSKKAEEKSSSCAGLHSNFNAKKEEALRLIEKMDKTVNHLDYDALKVERCSALDAIVSGLEQKGKDLQHKYREAEKKCSRFKDLSDTILPGKDEEIKNLSSVIESDNTQGEEARIIAEERRLTELRSSLSHESEKEARKAIDMLIGAIEDLENKIDQVDKDVRKCKEEITGMESLKSELEGRIDEKLDSDLTNVDNEISINKVLEGEYEEKKTSANSRLIVNGDALEKIKREKDAYNSICQEYEWKKNLSDTLRGTLSGKEKIELETFVLMSYFDRILYKASIRLYEMSSGQYELVRSTSSGNLREKTGLGIAVKDHHSGKTRDVSSLSGGESFLASLALALGLSDETQSSSGGIKIDTMFVDEGFGSLSPEVLELALKTLERLAQKGTLIGLISHVESMKKRYKSIDVEKTLNEGSKITINLKNG